MAPRRDARLLLRDRPLLRRGVEEHHPGGVRHQGMQRAELRYLQLRTPRQCDRQVRHGGGAGGGRPRLRGPCPRHPKLPKRPRPHPHAAVSFVEAHAAGDSSPRPQAQPRAPGRPAAAAPPPPPVLHLPHHLLLLLKSRCSFYNRISSNHKIRRRERRSLASSSYPLCLREIIIKIVQQQ